jgi:hypothetical protein
MQVFELVLHLAVPGGVGVEAEVSKRGFHIRSDTGLWLRRAHGVSYVATTSVGDGVRDGPAPSPRPLRRP